MLDIIFKKYSNKKSSSKKSLENSSSKKLDKTGANDIWGKKWSEESDNKESK